MDNHLCGEMQTKHNFQLKLLRKTFCRSYEITTTWDGQPVSHPGEYIAIELSLDQPTQVIREEKRYKIEVILCFRA